ncbi:MAG TPA: ribosome recycling factor [bacterium]|jgi:ribosome recycling factor|nr:ribosome recycling factor [bacterium]
MSEATIKDMREKMDKTVDVMSKEFANVRTGRANAGLLDGIKVSYYGSDLPLQQIASISVVEGRNLEIKPFDASALAEIEKALFQANLGLTPQNDGKLVRLSFPPLTEERRKELAKTVKKLAEDAKVSLRNIRRDANDKVKASAKAKTLSEDEAKDSETQIQKHTDAVIKKVDDMAVKKEHEVLTL